jgi:hypothetical protein
MQCWSSGVSGFKCINPVFSIQSLVARRVLRRFERLERFEPFRGRRLAFNKTYLDGVSDKLGGAFHAERPHHFVFVGLDGPRG